MRKVEISEEEKAAIRAYWRPYTRADVLKRGGTLIVKTEAGRHHFWCKYAEYEGDCGIAINCSCVPLEWLRPEGD